MNTIQRKSGLFLSTMIIALLILPILMAKAGAVETLEDPIEAIIMDEEQTTILVNPRYQHLSRVSSSLSFSAAGRAECTGAFTTYDTYDSTITITLQQFVNARWVDVKEWSQDYSGSGVKYLNKGYYVPNGRYRLATTVQIWDGNREIENAYCLSPIQEF